MVINQISTALTGVRLPLRDEKKLQSEIAEIFLTSDIPFEREYRLDNKNIPDFYCDGLAIEVKIGNSSKEILRQCKRYSEFDKVKTILLITNRAMGFPATINGKDCFVFNIAKAWL